MSAIVKHACEGPVWLGGDGLEGDQQGNLEAHGGPDKAVCAYPVEHVPEWERRLGVGLPPGAFGENLSVEGVVESAVYIGDVFELGGAVVQVSQPRGPCYKLAARWGAKQLPGWMAKEGISGYYLRVLEEGEVNAGDPLRLVLRSSTVSVAEVMRVTFCDRRDDHARATVLAVPELAEQWRELLNALARRSRLPSFTGSD